MGAPRPTHRELLEARRCWYAADRLRQERRRAPLAEFTRRLERTLTAINLELQAITYWEREAS